MKKFQLFDTLMHIKKDNSWYKTDKKSNYKDIQAMYAKGVLKGGVIACMPDDNPAVIYNIMKNELPQFHLVIAMKKEWQKLNSIELTLFFEKLKIKYHIVGIKIHPRFSHIRLDNDYVIDKVLKCIKNAGLMAYLCTINRSPVGPNSVPLHYLAAQIAERHSTLDIVFLHGGYTDLFSFGEVIRDYPNAWLDLSFTFMRFRKSALSLDCGYLMETLDRKLMIGTDFPEYTPDQLFAALEKYIFSRHDLELTNEKINNVLNKNIEGLIKKYATEYQY